MVVFSNMQGTWRYTNWTSDIQIQGILYSSVPLLDVRQKSEDMGGMDDAEIEVEIDKSVQPLPALTMPFKYMRTRCDIYEAFPGLDQCATRLLFSGIVGGVRSKPHTGAVLSAKVSLRGPKALLRVPLGIACTSTCAWVFGDKNCRACPGLYAVGNIQTRVSGVVNRISFNSAVLEDVASGKFVGATLNVAGIQLGVAAVVSQASTLYTLDLVEIPPTTINGAFGVFSYGCDKTLATCRGVWDNEERFCGLGITMPLTNPTEVKQT